MLRRSTDSLFHSLYPELKQIASGRMFQERADHTLQATAVVHEAYFRLCRERRHEGWESRSQFLSAASEAMRRILVDHARARIALKRGGGKREQMVAEPVFELPLPAEEIIAIHEVLDRFAEEDPEKAELVKLRVFAGLGHQEAAEMLGISRATADRHWAYAKLRLYTMIHP